MFFCLSLSKTNASFHSKWSVHLKKVHLSRGQIVNSFADSGSKTVDTTSQLTRPNVKNYVPMNEC